MSKMISGYGIRQKSLSISKSSTCWAAWNSERCERSSCWYRIRPNPQKIPSKPKTMLVKTKQVGRFFWRFFTAVIFASCESLIPNSLAFFRNAQKASVTFWRSSSWPFSVAMTCSRLVVLNEEEKSELHVKGAGLDQSNRWLVIATEVPMVVN